MNANGKIVDGTSEDVALAFDEFMRAFEAFKDENDDPYSAKPYGGVRRLGFSRYSARVYLALSRVSEKL